MKPRIRARGVGGGRAAPKYARYCALCIPEWNCSREEFHTRVDCQTMAARMRRTMPAPGTAGSGGPGFGRAAVPTLLCRLIRTGACRLPEPRAVPEENVT
jgi:hypothetical protein